MSTNAHSPIGVFDSGIGGLTVVRALMERLPYENIVYFGDTARVPYGVFVLGMSAWQWSAGVVPEPLIMGWVSLLALAVNVGVAALLYAHRQGDAQARSVWLCSRNDALGNLAVMGAAAGVWATAHGWPDIAVALVLAGLALSSGSSVIRHARRELRAI